MTKKEAFEKIKVLLGMDDTKTFSDAKLMDGTLIQWEGDLTEGVALNVLDTDGNVLPAPDATHELEDGTKITTVGGLITAIEKAEVEEDEASDFEKKFAKHAEDFGAFVKRVEALEAKLAEYETKFSEVSKTITDTTTSTNEKFTKLVELVEAIADEPANPSQKPADVTKVKPMTAAETFMKYKDSLKTK